MFADRKVSFLGFLRRGPSSPRVKWPFLGTNEGYLAEMHGGLDTEPRFQALQGQPAGQRTLGTNSRQQVRPLYSGQCPLV